MKLGKGHSNTPIVCTEKMTSHFVNKDKYAELRKRNQRIITQRERMTIPSAWTISVVVVAGCFVVLTLISVVIAINFCRKNICKCRTYSNYERPIRKRTEGPTEVYTSMQRTEHVQRFDNTQRRGNMQGAGNIQMVDSVQRGLPMINEREYSDINQTQNFMAASQGSRQANMPTGVQTF